jgi:hypothetical protein
MNQEMRKVGIEFGSQEPRKVETGLLGIFLFMDSFSGFLALKCWASWFAIAGRGRAFKT